MKKIILIIIAVVIGFAAGYFCPRKKCEKTPENTVKPVVEEVMPATIHAIYSAKLVNRKSKHSAQKRHVAPMPLAAVFLILVLKLIVFCLGKDMN